MSRRFIPGPDAGWLLVHGKYVRIASQQPVTDEILESIVSQLPAAPVHERHRAFDLTLLTTTACNLACGYCFQNTGSDPISEADRPFVPPLRIPRKRLIPSQLDAIFAFVDERMERANCTSLNMVLFGGEPLLQPKTCLRALEIASARNLVNSQMVTNGVLLKRTLAKSLADRGLQKFKLHSMEARNVMTPRV